MTASVFRHWSCVALMVALPAVAFGWKKTDCVICRTDRAVPNYAAGETMTFIVELRGFEGADRKTWKINWERTADDGRKEFGTAAADSPFIYRTQLDRPGFVRLCGSLVDGAGRPVKRDSGNGREIPVVYDLGAGVDVLKIRQAVPAPKDFNALWAAHRANLASVAWKDGVRLRELVSPTEGLKLYEFSVPCYGGRPATGHLALPTDVSRRYPATVKFFGYYESWTYERSIRPPKRLAKDRISMFVSAHGFEMGREKEYYADECEKSKSNGFGHGFDPVQNADPEKTYYAGMTYRIMRAIEYLKSRPEWNGRELVVTGGSQGGLQSIWAAALVPGVSEARVSIPWNCDIGGTELGRNRGTWYVKWVPALGYYDACNMAPLIPKTCRVSVTMAGLGDYICPPTGVMAFYNALQTGKTITFFQNTRHGDRLEPDPQRFSLDGDVIREGRK